jgi:hypothetical protein
MFFFNLVISTAYISFVGYNYARYKLSQYALFLLLSPILFLWVIICGGQYNVGTDYFAYLGVFNGDISYYFRKGEYLFYFLVKYCNYLGLRGQSLFFIFYGIGFLFLFLFLKKLQIKYIFIYIILYITVANVFNNQLNTLRQCIAIYIGTYGIILYLENKKIYSIALVVFASLIHTIAITFFIIYIICLFYNQKRIFYYLLLTSSFFLGIGFKLEWLGLLVNMDFLPPVYVNYIKGDRITQMRLIFLLSKYIFLPFYILSIKLVGKKYLTKIESKLFFIGFASFCLRLVFLNMAIVSRITYTFILLSIFPLYFYFRETLRKNCYFIFPVSMFFLFLLYFYKIVVPQPEVDYSYQSIFFR